MVIGDDGLRRVVSVSAELRYLPNKLHGDEVVAGDGRAYTELQDEWLEAGEVEDFLVEHPDPPMIFIDRFVDMPVVYEFRSPARKVWESAIRPRYMSADGHPPEGLDYSLVGYLWADADGRKLLLFELDH